MKRLQDVLFAGLLICSVLLNILLAHRLRERQTSARTIQTRAGIRLPPLRAKKIDGSPVSLDLSARRRPLLLYVFAPSCRWCERNFANVDALSRAVSPEADVIGLSLADSGPQHDRHAGTGPYPFDVYTGPDKAAFEAYELGSTPHLLYVSADGLLVREWRGAFIGATASEIETAFDVTLPGLKP